MIWILTIILCVFVVETALRLPLLNVVADIASISNRAMRTLASTRISDHWKEVVMLKYAIRLFKSAITLSVLLTIIALVVLASIYASDYFGVGLGEFLYTGIGLIYSTISATAYYYLRKRIVRHKLQFF